MYAILLFLSLTVPAALSADLVPVFIWDSFRDTSSKYLNLPVLSAVSKREFRGILNEKLQDNDAVLVFVEENLSIEDLSWQDESGQGAFANLQNLSRSGEADLLYLPFVDSPLDVLEHMFPATPTIWNEASLIPEGVPILSKDTPYSHYLRINLEDAKDNDDRPVLLKRHDFTIADLYRKMRQEHNHVIAIYTAHHSSWHVEEKRRSRKIRGVKDGLEETRRHRKEEIEETDNEETKEGKNNSDQDVEGEREERRKELHSEKTRLEKNYTTPGSQATTTMETPVTSPEPPPTPVPEGPPLMTIPILSGLMVTSILLGILSVAIAAMMDIKPTLRFDDPKGKALSFATAE